MSWNRMRIGTVVQNSLDVADKVKADDCSMPAVTNFGRQGKSRAVSCCLAAAFFVSFWPVLAVAQTQPTSDSIITINSTTSIVNISATQDGTRAYNSGQTLWYQPFSTNSKLLELPVQAGTYSFRIVDPADAVALFPSLTTAQQSQIFTAWTYNTPWITNYLVFDVSAVANSSEPQIIYGAPTPAGSGNTSAQQAYDEAVTNSYTTTYYHFTAPTTLIFSVPDYGLYDNAGGISVLVQSYTPPINTIYTEVPGTAGPWNYVNGGLNTTFQYGQGDQTSPAVVNAASGLAITPGSALDVKYVNNFVAYAGTSSSGFDAGGNTSVTANNNVGTDGASPSYYIPSSQYPVYGVELVGVFTDGTGEIIGSPFKVGDSGLIIVPAGAAQLQLGVNDNFYSDNFGSWTVSVSMAPAPAFSSSPAGIAFGNQLVGLSSTADAVTVKNAGGADLDISGVAISGTNAGDFAITSDNCTSQTIAANGTCAVSVSFTPSAAGAESASLDFTDNASGSPQSIGLTGTGVLPTATVSPSSLTFTSQVVGTTSSAQTVTLSNTGSVALTITGISTNLSAFAVAAAGTTCSTSSSSPLAAGSRCAINVTFTPSATGVVSGTLTVADNATGSPQTVTLSGTGEARSVTLSATSLNFNGPTGGQVVGSTSAAQTLTLTNNSAGPLTVSSISASGDFAETNDCGTTLAAGASCTITVTFSPVSAGPQSGVLTIVDNAPNSPQTVALSGTGQDFNLGNFTTSSSVTPGGGTSYLLDLRSVGGFSGDVALSCSGVPADTTCSISPASATLSSGEDIHPIVQVQTTAAAALPPAEPTPPSMSPAAVWLVLLTLLSLLTLGFIRTKGASFRRAFLPASAALLLAAAFWSSCGGGLSAPHTPTGGTPAGTSTITIKATSGSLAHSTTVSLTVQ